MEPTNTNTNPTVDTTITDENLNEVVPTTNETESPEAVLTEAEALAAAGQDASPETVTDMNNEDEEAEKEAPAI